VTDQITEQVTDTGTAESTNGHVEEVNGQMLLIMFEGAAGLLERHVPHINSLNVFPVPDGDTGTNMMLTVQSAIKELRGKFQDGEPVEDVANRMARGALMGARGNSGVILSQILRGFAKGLEGKQCATAQDFVDAMQNASDMAYKAVVKPVEGTILTVVREAADEAKQRVDGHGENNLVQLLHAIVDAAKRAELRTPELLPVLKEAGVTDSGGHGLWVFLDGALRNLKGERIAPSGKEVSTAVAEPVGFTETLEGEWGYDIQYLIKGTRDRPLNVDAIREYITSIGDSTLVVGDEMLVKVHVHCPNPGPAITYGAEQGVIADVVVENVDEQAEEFLHEERASGVAEPTRRIDEVTGVGIVAVAPGEGLAEVFRSLGVGQIISGGQTMNPSTRDLLDAVEAVEAETVIILPNNKNIILAAGQVPELSSKDVRILPTRTVPQGIAAVMSFNYTAGVEENLGAMQESLTAIHTGEVTTAIRTTTIDGVSVQEGDFIGLLDGKLVVADKTTEAVIRDMLGRIDLEEFEIVTFYYGEDVDPAEAEAVVEGLQDEYEDLEIDLVAGGQPHYHYIFSVE
jgi:uncharacterized protein